MVCANRREIDERDKDGEKADAVKDQDHALQTGESFDKDGVDEEGEQQHGIENEGALPPHGVVIRVVD